jgi:hypothetical protein
MGEVFGSTTPEGQSNDINHCGTEVLNPKSAGKMKKTDVSIQILFGRLLVGQWNTNGRRRREQK